MSLIKFITNHLNQITMKKKSAGFRLNESESYFITSLHPFDLSIHRGWQFSSFLRKDYQDFRKNDFIVMIDKAVGCNKVCSSCVIKRIMSVSKKGGGIDYGAGNNAVVVLKSASIDEREAVIADCRLPF